MIVDAIFPCIHWLLLGEAPRSSIEQFVEWIGERLRDYEPCLVRLECSDEVRNHRAIEQRGRSWQARFATRRSLYPLYQRLGESVAKPLVEEESLRLSQRLPWRQQRISTSNRTPQETLVDLAGRLDFPMPARVGRIESLQNWIGQYRVVDGEGPDIEIAAIDGGPIASFSGIKTPLLPEPDGRWLIEGANAWLTPNVHEHALIFTRPDVADAMYARR